GLKVDDDFLTPDEFQQSTRCLILHHHPVDLKKGLKGLSGLLTKKFTVLRGADKLLNLIKGRVDVIFHGHEHFPICFRHRETGVIIVSAGTVSEWTARPFQNSFYIVTLFSDYTLAVQEYLWTGSKFQSREKHTGQKP